MDLDQWDEALNTFKKARLVRTVGGSTSSTHRPVRAVLATVL